VVQQAKGERNFHVFYQLAHGASRLEPHLRSLLHLDAMPPFRYLAERSEQGRMRPAAHTADDASASKSYDANEFLRTLKALSCIGFDDDGVKGIVSTLAAILHLGNVNIVGGEGVDHAEEAQGLLHDAGLFPFMHTRTHGHTCTYTRHIHNRIHTHTHTHTLNACTNHTSPTHACTLHSAWFCGGSAARAIGPTRSGAV